jgi:hypothetical protein
LLGGIKADWIEICKPNEVFEKEIIEHKKNWRK